MLKSEFVTPVSSKVPSGRTRIVAQQRVPGLIRLPRVLVQHPDGRQGPACGEVVEQEEDHAGAGLGLLPCHGGDALYGSGQVLDDAGLRLYRTKRLCPHTNLETTTPLKKKILSSAT